MNSEQQSLLKAIVTSPEEDSVRLIYADYLDDYIEEHEQAEFIRLQVELYRGPSVMLSIQEAKAINNDPEYKTYLMQSHYALRDVCEGRNAKYALPEMIYGVRINVDPTAETTEYMKFSMFNLAWASMEWKAKSAREQELINSLSGLRRWVCPLVEALGTSIKIDRDNYSHHGTKSIYFGIGRELQYTFSRGFMSRITMSADDFLLHADKMIWHPDQKEKCHRCEGSGEAYGADRLFEWSADADYGKCVVCKGSGQSDECRSFPITAQPITLVKLKDIRPEFFLNLGHYAVQRGIRNHRNLDGVLEKLWPGVKVDLGEYETSVYSSPPYQWNAGELANESQ